MRVSAVECDSSIAGLWMVEDCLERGSRADGIHYRGAANGLGCLDAWALGWVRPLGALSASKNGSNEETAVERIFHLPRKTILKDARAKNREGSQDVEEPENNWMEKEL